MTITRLQAETILVRRLGPLLTKAGMDGETTKGTNSDLNDPLVSALLTLGHTAITNVMRVTDTDLSVVTVTEVASFFDLAEYRACESILGNLDDVDITVGPRRESLSQLARQVERKMERLQYKIVNEHGIALGALEVGVIDMGFQTRGDDTVV